MEQPQLTSPTDSSKFNQRLEQNASEPVIAVDSIPDTTSNTSIDTTLDTPYISSRNHSFDSSDNSNVHMVPENPIRMESNISDPIDSHFYSDDTTANSFTNYTDPDPSQTNQTSECLSYDDSIPEIIRLIASQWKISVPNNELFHFTRTWKSLDESPLADDENRFLFSYYIDVLSSMASNVPCGEETINPSRNEYHQVYPNFDNFNNGFAKNRFGFGSFWSYEIPLMAHYYPHITYAVLSFSALHYSERLAAVNPQTDFDFRGTSDHVVEIMDSSCYNSRSTFASSSHLPSSDSISHDDPIQKPYTESGYKFFMESGHSNFKKYKPFYDAEAMRFRQKGFFFYGKALKIFNEDILLLRRCNPISLFSTCILLSQFELFLGDFKGWTHHITGAASVAKGFDLSHVFRNVGESIKKMNEYDRQYSTPTHKNATQDLVPNDSFKLSAVEIGCLHVVELFWNYQIADIMHSVFSKTIPITSFDANLGSLFIALGGRNDPHKRAVFEVFVELKTINIWIGKDARRKVLAAKDQSNPDTNQKNLETAIQEWESLLLHLNELEAKYIKYLTPISEDELAMYRNKYDELSPEPLQSTEMTPFGPLLRYRSSLEQYLSAVFNFTIILLLQSDPSIPEIGFSSLKFLTHKLTKYITNLIRSLPYAYNIESFGRKILLVDPETNSWEQEVFPLGQLIRMFMDFSVYVMFGSTSITDELQREYVLNWLSECRRFTGCASLDRSIDCLQYAWSLSWQCHDKIENTNSESGFPGADTQSVVYC